MDVYTAQYGYSGPDRMDITVKGAEEYYGRLLAPEWGMVNKIKSGEIDEEMYERMYRALMNDRYRYADSYMEGFAKRDGTKTLVCFCPAGGFCHRIIAAEGLEKMGAVYKGERNFRQESENIYTIGDMLDVTRGIIAHQVNCQGVMGAGIAKVIADKWPHVKEKYVDLTKKTLIDNVPVKQLLGTAYPIPVNDQLYVANLFGQNRYGRDKRYTNYSALRQALNRLKKWRDSATDIFKDELPIFFPYRMSCSNAGGDWYLVFKMIKNVFPDAIIIKKE